ncbi:MAG: prolyl oligopeptidase family serine peptidase [Cyclobacteriaceae bacterium]
MRLTILFSSILLGLYSYGQSFKNIEGTVYYQETKQPVPFAYVKLEGIAYGTVTEFDGTFSLKIPERHFDKNLEFSYVGLKTQKLAISSYALPVKIYLDTEITELYTVIVSAKRDLNPKSVLKKALNAIPENYVNEEFGLSGFYREYVKENSTPVKYADAAFELNLKPYTGKEEKNKAFQNPVDLSGVTTIGSWSSRSSSLHRWHFHQKVLKGEIAKIIQSKASDDLNQTRLYANIQGGPLSVLTKDRVKYPGNFLSNFGKYDYELLEVEKNNEGYFLINFEPEMTPEKMEKKKRYFNYPYKLGGSILIRKDDLAITEINYSVPPEYKKFICGYRGWSVRHFDFSVQSKYTKKDGRYVLDYLKHADEFIVEDTAVDRRVPYAAISEFFTHEVKEPMVNIGADENFSNSDYTFLFDHPEGYDSLFWNQYEQEHPLSVIPEEIYSSMSIKTPLEKQFANKLTRDTTLAPPVAKKEPVKVQMHGQSLTDDYAWLKDTKNPLGNEEIMQHLSNENAYTNNYFKPLKPLQRELFKEVRSYVQDDFESLPRIENGFQYYYKYVANNEYPIYYRKSIKKDAVPELLFDVNKMAEDHSYFSFGGLTTSPNNMIAAYSENKTANDRWMLKFKNLETGKILMHTIDYIGGMIWLTDSTVAYTKLEPKTFLSSKAFHFNINTGEHTLIYKEEDPRFSVGLSKSRSRQFAFLSTSSSDQNEIRLLNLNNPDGPWRIVSPRREGHIYGLSHYEDKFYILTNHKAINNRMMVADTSSFKEKNWKEEIPHNTEIHLMSVLPFKKWMVYHERHGLEYKVRVVNREDGNEHYIKQGNDRAVNLGLNSDFETDTLRISKATYHRPLRVYDYNMEKKKFHFLKQIGEYSPSIGATVETVYAVAKDGTKIPITLIYFKGAIKNLKKQGNKPFLYVTGYGSYGSSYSAGYNPNMSPLLLKGFVYAIAHVRGGGDLGEKWYQEGKKLNKKNSFTDFIACTEYLIAEGYGEKGEVIAEGGSAGGLLMGAVANLRPDLYKLLILNVPFVDVVNTMLDTSLPLTTLEYEEWGDPNEKKYFKYIKSYSPYENVEAKNYPNMLFLTAINDSRVGYWEPAKMVAKLRELKTDNNEVLMRTDFSAGHGGASGRYAALAEVAFKYALILELVSQ